jgi:hypothetical protein
MTTAERDKLAATVQPRIDALTPDMIPIVECIETGPMSGTTQHNYARYMSTIATLCPDSDPRMLYIVGRAMIAAGGNEAGIKSAIAIITGRDVMAVQL